MSKKLVAFFSASGVTASVASLLADAASADLFEIRPEVPYTSADLDWTDKKSRSTIEMNNADSRPAIIGRAENMESYDTVFLGFPIWWYREPSIIDTFLEQYDFSGKTIVLFATSGSSGFGRTAKGIAALAPQAKIIEGPVYHGSASAKKIASWLGTLDL